MNNRVTSATRLFVVLNPMAGRSSSEQILAALERHCADSGQQLEVYMTTGEEDIVAIVRAALRRGFDLVVAVGGDGTVSEVAEALVYTNIPLGIIPVGTANVFARELALPLDLNGACALLAGAFATSNVDAMQIGAKCYILHVGVGIGSLMHRNTSRDAKRRFGRLAYVWTALRSLFGFQPRRFMLVVDGERHRYNASHVMIANGGVLGVELFRWGTHIHPDDGQIDVCIVNARTVRDYLAIAWDTLTRQHHRNRRLRYLIARQSVAINTRRPLPVQADGEIIGNTPVQMRVLRRAVCVAVPNALSPAS